MIESITIKEVASFDETGVSIENLKKVNFIYGVNGSGKTTVSNFIANPDSSKFGKCTIKWKENFPTKALVYNREFRETYFGTTDIAGVFTLGKATKQELEAIEQKRTEIKEFKKVLTQKHTTLTKQKEDLQTLNDDFTTYCWDSIYKKKGIQFKEALKGSLKSNLFRDRLLNEITSNTSEIVAEEELIEKANTILGEPPVEIDLISEITYSNINEIENLEIWKQKVVGKKDVQIAQLIQSLNINDWVSQGKEYLQEDSDICPFCQKKTITKEFRKQLEDYFDETYTKSINEINSKKNQYFQDCENLVNVLNGIETKQESLKESKLELAMFSAYLKTINSQTTSNKELISAKIKEPSRDIKLTQTEEQFIKIAGLIEKANKEIDKHNGIVKRYGIERSKFINEVWKFLIEEFKEELNKQISKIKGVDKGVVALREQFNKLKLEYAEKEKELKKLENNMTSVQPTVNEINDTLKSYGFLNFMIVPSEQAKNHYQIQREDGSLAHQTLSEGEITFITFLYFLQSAKGSFDEDTISDERILVIDDPISSLDSNVLYVVSSLIKEIIKGIKAGTGIVNQLILLTHNVFFHKEVSFVNGNKQNDDNVNFWILRKVGKKSTIQFYDKQNPIHTSYELLWRELKEYDKNSGITVQNTMRRIIENYFRILGKFGDDELIQKFESNEEREICRSLLCWINDGSHSINDDLFIEAQTETIEKYQTVFKNIFKHTKHEEHYNMMMGIEVEEEIGIFEEDNQTSHSEEPKVITGNLKSILKIMNGNKIAFDIKNGLGIKNHQEFEKEYLYPAINAGLIVETFRKKKKRQYCLTNEGLELKNKLGLNS